MQEVDSGKQRRLGILLSVFLSLIIAAVATYYVIQSNEASKSGLSEYATGATNIVAVDTYVGQPDDFTAEAQRADIVVEGVIETLLPARWSTPDGAPPDKLTLEVLKNLNVHIRTPVRLSVKRVFKGNNIGNTLMFSFVGGRVGDTAIVAEGNESYAQGNSIIVFLSKGGPDNPASIVDPSGLFPRTHLVVKGEVAQGPIKDIPLKDLVRQIQQGN